MILLLASLSPDSAFKKLKISFVTAQKKRGNYTFLLVPQIEALALPYEVERASIEPTMI